MPSGQHFRKKKPVVTKGQHGHPRSTRESAVEDRYLNVVAQTQSEDVEGISPKYLRKGFLKSYMLREQALSNPRKQVPRKKPRY